MVRVQLPLYLPTWAYSALRSAKRTARSVAGTAPDLFGDREVEWSFVGARLPRGPGRLLDFGASFGMLSMLAAQRGFSVLAVDLEPERFAWKHPGVEFLQADLLQAELPVRSFDVVVNCSSVEHVGLAGRYGVTYEESDGDLLAMEKLRALLKPNGVMLMTIPCGQDAVIAPWHRVYGKQRLPKLLAGFEAAEEVFWLKHRDNRWHTSERNAALSFAATRHPDAGSLCCYALGCFVLRPQAAAG
jgi:SAM-dependent methyltransferase